MIDRARVPDVTPDEIVARYVLYRRHVRADQTVKPDAFIPHPHRDLSVTRHYLASEAELWQVGEKVASDRGMTLRGRADFQVEVVRGQKLEVVPDPIPDNPNHANVKDWPPDKPAQKLIAAELAKASAFRACPPRSSPNPAAPAGPAARTGWLVRASMVCRGFVAQLVRGLRAIFRRKSP